MRFTYYKIRVVVHKNTHPRHITTITKRFSAFQDAQGTGEVSGIVSDTIEEEGEGPRPSDWNYRLLPAMKPSAPSWPALSLFSLQLSPATYSFI